MPLKFKQQCRAWKMKALFTLRWQRARRLQWPFASYEFQVQARNAMRRDVPSSYHSEQRGLILRAAQFHKTARRKIQGSKDGRALAADILGNCILTVRKTSVLCKHLDQNFNRNVVARVLPLICCRDFRKRFAGCVSYRPQALSAGSSDLVAS